MLPLRLLITVCLMWAVGGAYADPGCLGGISSSSSCVTSSDAIYGIGSGRLTGQSSFDQLLSHRSAGGLIGQQNFNKELKALEASQRTGGLGPSSGSSGFGSFGSGSSLGSYFSNPSSALSQGHGNSHTSAKPSTRHSGGGNGQSSKSASTHNASQNGLSISSSRDKFGEHTDSFGNSAERDDKGSLVTCLKDAFGHQICM